MNEAKQQAIAGLDGAYARNGESLHSRRSARPHATSRQYRSQTLRQQIDHQDRMLRKLYNKLREMTNEERLEHVRQDIERKQAFIVRLRNELRDRR